MFVIPIFRYNKMAAKIDKRKTKKSLVYAIKVKITIVFGLECLIWLF